MGQEVYNDNAVQYGSRVETIRRGYVRATSQLIQTTVLENITINRPVREIDRHDEIGGPNGWVAINAQVDGSCVVQMGPANSKWPHNGDWIEDTFDADLGVERFVLLAIGQPFEQLG